MKIFAQLFLFAACLTAALTLKAQTLLTDFSTSANLGASTALVGATGAYAASGGVADYTVSSPAESDFVHMAYTGAVGSYSSNWSVWVNVNYGAPTSIFTNETEQFINLGLMVVQTGVTPGVVGNAPNFHAFLIESNLYQNASNDGSRDIRTAVFAPGTATDDATRYALNSSVSIATATAVKISFDAGTKILTAGFDAAGGASFTSIPTLTGDANTWGMTGADTFSIYLMANSGYDGGATGLGPVITGGGATLDNLYGNGLTAVPEPSTYAALLGMASLGLAAWRRQRRTAAVSG